MPASKKPTVSQPDAITLLTDDHKKVKKLFKDYEKLKDKGSSADKQALVQEICHELIVHTEIEDEVFYPAVRAATKDDDLVDEGEVEHASARDLIDQLLSMKAEDDLYDAKVTVLNEYIEHHVGEEEKEMFPEAKKAKMDLKALGEKLQELKEMKQAQLAAASKGNAASSKTSTARH